MEKIPLHKDLMLLEEDLATGDQEPVRSLLTVKWLQVAKFTMAPESASRDD